MEDKLQQMRFVRFANGVMVTDGEVGVANSYSMWRHTLLGSVLVAQLSSGNVMVYKAYDPEELIEDARAKGEIVDEVGNANLNLFDSLP